MANAERKHVTFETDYPAVDDFDFRNTAHGNLACTRQKEMFTPKGVLKDYLNELGVYDDNPGQSTYVKVRTGASYVQGERAEVESVETVDLDSITTVDNVIWIKHAVEANTDPKAIRNDELGQPHTVWWDDAFELGATQTPAWTDPDDKLKLADVHWNGSALEITLAETWVGLEVPIGDGVVDENALAPGAVTESRLANWAVTENKLTVQAVSTGKLKDLAVTEAKLGNVAVTASKIATGAVVKEKLADGAVVADKIADDAVETRHLSDACVDTAQLATDAVETAKIANLQVTAAKLATNAVETSKIKNGAVNSDKIGDGQVTVAALGNAAVETAKIKDLNVTQAKLAAETDLVSIYEARVEKPGDAEDINPLATPVGTKFYAFAGITTPKYKIATWFRRLAPDGPINMLKMEYTWSVAGSPTPEFVVYLVCWPLSNPTPVADPDEGGFTGLKVWNTHNVGSGSDILELPLSGPETDKWLVGIVLKRNADCGTQTWIADADIVGAR